MSKTTNVLNKIALAFCLILTMSGCTKEDITDVTSISKTIIDPITGEAITSTLDGDSGVLMGAYGLTGTFTADATGIHINKDYAGNTAPGPVWWLSDNSRNHSGGVRLGAANKSGGAHTLSTTDAAGYTYLVLWCEPFSTPIGYGQIPK